MNVQGTVRKFILENSEDGENEFLKNDDSLLEKGIIDSLKMLELINFIEENFSITIDDEELMPDNFDSINAIADFIERKQAI